MISLAGTSGISSYHHQAQQSALDAENSAPHNKTDVTENKTNTATDVVSISDAARKISSKSDSLNYFVQFMPTYEGFSAANIASGVSNASLEPFSAGKNFEQVAMDARASLDKNYEQLKAIGKPYANGSAPSEAINSLFGELDRRALYVVSSNEGGAFTKHEQDMARSKMNQQQGLAMGLYNGPTSEHGKFIDPFPGDHVQKLKAGIIFLDGVSNEEKASSIEFAFQRAGLQATYERLSLEQGDEPEDFSTNHPLINLILAARTSAVGDFQRGFTEGEIRSADDLKAQTWFEEFEGLLDSAIRKTQNMYFVGSSA